MRDITKESKVDTEWIKEAKFRQKNKWWLDILFKIKLKYLLLKRKFKK